MESPNKRFPKSPLKQWVIYQGFNVCSAIVVSKKLKIMKSNTGSNQCWMSRCILTLRNQQTAIVTIATEERANWAPAITPGVTKATNLIPVSAVPRLEDEKSVDKSRTPDAKWFLSLNRINFAGQYAPSINRSSMYIYLLVRSKTDLHLVYAFYYRSWS